MSARIVITGGPGSGKSEALVRLRSIPRFQNFLFLEELARKLLRESPEMRHNSTAFHAEIYRQQTAREAALGERSFISDRGTIDAFAFHPEAMLSAGTTIEDEYQRYTSVVQLGSAASLGNEYYAVDDVRTETIQRALQIEKSIKEAWCNHHDYHFIAADRDFELKFSRLLSVLDDCIAPYTIATD